LTEEDVLEAVRNPDGIVMGHGGRKIAHKLKNDRVLRIVYEEDQAITIVTVYPARTRRYVGR